MKRSYAAHMKVKDRAYLGQWCLLSGPEQHLKRQVLDEIRESADSVGSEGEAASWNVLDGPSVTAADVLARSQTGALFGGARVIVMRDAERMASAEQEALAKAVGSLPDLVAVVLVTGEREARGRERTVRAGLRRAIEGEGLHVEFPSLKVQDAVAWAVARAKAKGKRLEPAAARKLVERKVGTGLGDIEAEIEKLALFAGDLDVITGDHVDEVTPRLVEDDIFRLVDAVGRKETGAAVGALRTLLGERRESPGRILWQLSQAIRLVWQTKLLVERGWRPGKDVDEETAAMLPEDDRKNALREFARLPWKAKRTMAQAKRLSWGQLRRAVRALHGCDLAMKGIRGTITDDAAALELLIVQLCSDVDIPVWKSRRGERVLG